MNANLARKENSVHYVQFDGKWFAVVMGISAAALNFSDGALTFQGEKVYSVSHLHNSKLSLGGAASNDEAPRYAAQLKRLRFIATLPEGWNEHDSDSVPPAPEVAAAAAQLIESVPNGYALPWPTLSNESELGLFWNTPKLYANLVLTGPFTFSLYTRELEGEKREQFIPEVRIADINPSWFAAELAGIRLTA